MKKRKRQIIQAARSLFIEKGFVNTSILDIIAAANISKGTFYNHFSSKNECLIAIIEESREDIVNQRYEVALNEDPSNVEILVKQISILLQVNRKKDLVQIFESYSRYSDIEMKKVFENHLILETDWLANRLVDIYGENIRDIAYDCAVFTIGMLQQSIKMVFLATGKLDAPEVVIRTVLCHVFAMIPSIKNEQKLMTSDIVRTLQNKIEDKSVSKSELIIQLEGFVEKLSNNDPENGVELANHLLLQLKSAEEKIYVLQSILFSFNKAFENTAHKAEVHEISIAFWEYLHKQRNSSNS